MIGLGCSGPRSEDEDHADDHADDHAEDAITDPFGAETGSDGDSTLGGGSANEGGDAGVLSGSDGSSLCAEEQPVDLLLVLDISGSMLDVVPGSVLTKWDAVRSALETFVQSPMVEDVGLGLHYFPQLRADVPTTCVANAECGPLGGPCSNSVCVVPDLFEPDPTDLAPPFQYLRESNPRTFCASDTDCATVGGTCRTTFGECLIPAGTFVDVPNGAFLDLNQSLDPIVKIPVCEAQVDCSNLPGTICQEVGICGDLSQPCSPSLACPLSSGGCLSIPDTCVEQTLCEVTDYATPAVAVAVTPDRTDAILGSLRSQSPVGLTPTGPALRGALVHARARVEQDPERGVAIVLVTDGFPTECDPVEIPDLAALAQAEAMSSPAIRTFVIGVFSSLDLGVDGQARLDMLAAAGGTESAFVVDSAGNLTEEFLAALSVIPEAAACPPVL